VNENGDCLTRFHFNFQIHHMTTIAISGSRSGIGAATAAALSALGHHLIGIDLRDADVCADLSDPAGRAAAVQAVLLRCDGVLDGLVLCAARVAQRQQPQRRGGVVRRLVAASLGAQPAGCCFRDW
jgi:NAD(P)-dependent dehydrogenase (short-subunit alcohol dehydrogenase family)